MTIASAAAIAAPDVPRAGPRLYLSVGLLAGAVIALQIAVMRVFSVGSWTHFGSLVVSLALLGFGLSSVAIFVGKAWFERHWRASAGVALWLFGPLAVASNLVAQTVPFNAIFLTSDPSQIWRLLANFLLYLLPFLCGAMFLGIVFLKSRTGFGRVYFADLTGSGLAGLLVLAAMYVLPPEKLIAVPLALWALSGLMWIGPARSLGLRAFALIFAALTIFAYFLLPGLLGIPDIAVSQYKGVAYARNFPDATRIYRSISPFGDLQVYSSSYMHFSPGLSDNAAFNLPELPGKSFVGLYIDGEGPEGIMRDPPAAAADYFRYLPMYYPYVLRANPDTFVVQFGGGISTAAALHSGSKSVTVAESNPAVLKAFSDPGIAAASSDILADPRVRIVSYDGRLFLKHTANRYDVIDLSLADSVGLSNPGGFAITEKYAYTTEAMLDYMRALSDDGVLSITVWNKEEPPKSLMKLYSTVANAARRIDPAAAANSIFVSSSYLSTATVLYRKGGFTADELTKLRAHTSAMSWDEIYSPGLAVDATQGLRIFAQYKASIFGDGSASPAADPTTSGDTSDVSDAPTPVPATTLTRLYWHALMTGDGALQNQYVFDTEPLTNSRPYFAAYEKLGDLPHTLDRLDLFQDDWGYLLLWATLGVAAMCAAVLIVLPVVLGWRDSFSRAPGKLGTIGFFAALGLGYITVEVGLISRFTLALSNPTISASVLISSMLLFSGLGSLLSERIFEKAKWTLPVILLVIAALLVAYGLLLDPILDWIGAFPFVLRLLLCFLLVAPPAFLMGYPMSTAMTSLTRLGKDHLFVWAWGINGCSSVIGAAAVPIIETTLGLPAVLEVSALAYLVAIPTFFAVLRPSRVGLR